MRRPWGQVIAGSGIVQSLSLSLSLSCTHTHTPWHGIETGFCRRSLYIMYNNQWGGPMELSLEVGGDDDRSVRSVSEFERDRERPSRRTLDETQQSWLLEPARAKRKPNVDLGCVECNRKCFWWFICLFWAACVITGVGVVIWKFAPRKHHAPPTPDNYTVALSSGLSFFDAQKCECFVYWVPVTYSPLLADSLSTCFCLIIWNSVCLYYSR